MELYLCLNNSTNRLAGQQTYINTSAPWESSILIRPWCGLSQVITVIGTLLKRVIQLCPEGEHRPDLNSTNWLALMESTTLMIWVTCLHCQAEWGNDWHTEKWRIKWMDLDLLTVSSWDSWGQITGGNCSFHCLTFAWSQSESLYTKHFIHLIMEAVWPPSFTYFWYSSPGVRKPGRSSTKSQQKKK